jgi:hypothetical protein
VPGEDSWLEAAHAASAFRDGPCVESRELGVEKPQYMLMSIKQMEDLEDVVWNRVGDRWLTGKSAAAGLGVSGLVSMLLVATMIGVVLGGRGESALPRLLWETIVFLGVGGGLLLMSAMRRYWAKLDDQTGAMHRIWRFFLRFLMLFGPVLYYLCVYIPQLRRRWAADVRSGRSKIS